MFINDIHQRYGFHKVNKSPRGHRTTVESQVWEFSHPKFIRNHPELLDDIKRKSMESESLRRETGDLQSQIAVMQVAQSDMQQQISHLQENFTEVLRELAETKRQHNFQQQLLNSVIEYLPRQNVPCK
jgi:heat shock transcription factor 4